MTNLQGEYNGKKEIFTFIDLESTDLDHEKGQIIEIGAIQTDLERELGRMSVMVELKDDQSIPDFISNLTGIKENDLVNGAPEQYAVIMLGLFVRGTTVVAQYAPFDLSYLETRGFSPEFFIDTRTMSRLIDPEESASLKDVFPRLFGEPVPNHHRAVSDCEATIRLFKEQLKRAEAAGIERMSFQNVVVDSPKRPLRYKPNNAIVKEMDLDKREGGDE